MPKLDFEAVLTRGEVTPISTKPAKKKKKKKKIKPSLGNQTFIQEDSP